MASIHGSLKGSTIGSGANASLRSHIRGGNIKDAGITSRARRLVGKITGESVYHPTRDRRNAKRRGKGEDDLDLSCFAARPSEFHMTDVYESASSQAASQGGSKDKRNSQRGYFSGLMSPESEPNREPCQRSRQFEQQNPIYSPGSSTSQSQYDYPINYPNSPMSQATYPYYGGMPPIPPQPAFYGSMGYAYPPAAIPQFFPPTHMYDPRQLQAMYPMGPSGMYGYSPTLGAVQEHQRYGPEPSLPLHQLHQQHQQYQVPQQQPQQTFTQQQQYQQQGQGASLQQPFMQSQIDLSPLRPFIAPPQPHTQSTGLPSGSVEAVPTGGATRSSVLTTAAPAVTRPVEVVPSSLLDIPAVMRSKAGVENVVPSVGPSLRELAPSPINDDSYSYRASLSLQPSETHTFTSIGGRYSASRDSVRLESPSMSSAPGRAAIASTATASGMTMNATARTSNASMSNDKVPGGEMSFDNSRLSVHTDAAESRSSRTPSNASNAGANGLARHGSSRSMTPTVAGEDTGRNSLASSTAFNFSDKHRSSEASRPSLRVSEIEERDSMSRASVASPSGEVIPSPVNIIKQSTFSETSRSLLRNDSNSLAPGSAATQPTVVSTTREPRASGSNRPSCQGEGVSLSQDCAFNESRDSVSSRSSMNVEKIEMRTSRVSSAAVEVAEAMEPPISRLSLSKARVVSSASESRASETSCPSLRAGTVEFRASRVSSAAPGMEDTTTIAHERVSLLQPRSSSEVRRSSVIGEGMMPRDSCAATIVTRHDKASPFAMESDGIAAAATDAEKRAESGSKGVAVVEERGSSNGRNSVVERLSVSARSAAEHRVERVSSGTVNVTSKAFSLNNGKNQECTGSAASVDEKEVAEENSSARRVSKAASIRNSMQSVGEVDTPTRRSATGRESQTTDRDSQSASGKTSRTGSSYSSAVQGVPPSPPPVSLGISSNTVGRSVLNSDPPNPSPCLSHQLFQSEVRKISKSVESEGSAESAISAGSVRSMIEKFGGKKKIGSAVIPSISVPLANRKADGLSRGESGRTSSSESLE
jgi:hypothetical protein